MDFQSKWLFRGYFEVSDPGGGPSFTQQVRDCLTDQIGQVGARFRIAKYPVGPVWKHTYWWREGNTEYAEVQFFARIAEEYPVLSAGVSIEKGIEKPDVVLSSKRKAYLMDRKTWDWERFKNQSHEILTADVPVCASFVSRPVVIRFFAHKYCHGKVNDRKRRVFIFNEGEWFERGVGKIPQSTIIDYIDDIDQWKDWWVDTYFCCDLFPIEVENMKADIFASILLGFNAIRKRIKSRSK